LGPSSAIIIAACIGGNEHLKQLNLAVNGIKAEGTAALANVLSQTKIESLKLDNTGLCGVQYGRGTFTLEGFTPLCEAFTKMPNLTSVSLAANGIGSDTQDKLRSEHPKVKFDF